MAFTTRSATQISTWRACKRKYGFQYVLGIRTPQTASQKLGTEVDDKQLQPYLRDGRPLDLDTDAGRIASAALEWLPTPTEFKELGGSVQAKIDLPGASKPAKWGYTGYKDLNLPQGGLPNWSAKQPSPDDTYTISDFKTCKTFDYQKNADDLKIDPQAVLYAVDAMRKTGAKQVRMRWLYIRTTGKAKAQPTDVVFTHEDVYAPFLEIERTAAEIHEYLAKAPLEGTEEAKTAFVMSTEPNGDHCDEYGGCFFQSRCGLVTLMGSSEKEFDVSADSVKARLAARRAAIVGGGGDTPAPKQLEMVGINPPERGVSPVAVAAGPATPPEPGKRKRRTKAEMEAARQALPEVSEETAAATKSLIAALDATEPTKFSLTRAGVTVVGTSDVDVTLLDAFYRASDRLNRAVAAAEAAPGGP